MAEEVDRTSQILAFVLDSLQVVSYKWLSRKLSISSNESKRLLQIVADQHASDVDVIYAVSGWSKTDKRCYSVKLVPKFKLQETKDTLSGYVSIHVYSIQPCTPRDPAELWGAEYVQSEDLFKQPTEINNCLRDNRFSGVVCGSVIRKVRDKIVTGSTQLATSRANVESATSKKAAAPSTGTTNVAAPSTGATCVAIRSTSPPQPSTVKAEGLPDLPSVSGQARQNMQESSGTEVGMAAKALGPKGVGAGKKNVAGTGDGGSLANLWGRATTKAKARHTEKAAAANTVKKETEALNDSCIDGSSDDEDVANFARLRRGDLQSGSKRTRRMIMDDDISDDDDAELEDKTVVTKVSPEKPNIKKENERSIVSEKKGKRLNASLPHLNEFKEAPVCAVGEIEKKVSDAANHRMVEPSSVAASGIATAAQEPKKRKVVKTRMDERGREVTEVVWETDNPAENDDPKEGNCVNAHGTVQVPPTKTLSLKSNAKASNAAAQHPANKGSGSGKSSGKGASKDAQQGRISSFFKKKN